jgi:hypothetical protein
MLEVHLGEQQGDQAQADEDLEQIQNPVAAFLGCVGCIR